MPTENARTLSLTIAIVGAVLFCATASADTYVLQPDGTGAFTTIQIAISSVLDGDIIELAPGTYDGIGNRDVDFHGKAVTVRGQTGDPADVIIDCQGSAGNLHKGFYFGSGEGPGSVVQDLTIVNGYTTGHGAAIYCQAASPTIDGCILNSNIAEGSERYGGAIYFSSESEPTVTGCSFTGNKASEFGTGRGGAIACRNGADAVISDCFFENNVAEYRGGAIYCDDCDVTISDCTVEGNYADSGAGIYLRYGTFAVTGCLILGNGTWDGRGGGLLTEALGNVEITDCTFFGNRANDGGAMYVNSPSFVMARTIVAGSSAGGGVWYAYEAHRDATISCCNVWNNVGGDYNHIIGDQTGINDNISADPLFCDPEGGDFTLYDTSPCVPDSSGCGMLIGALGIDCITAVEATSWGKVKSLYR